MSKFSIEILDRRPLERGSLKGFLTVEIPELHLRIRDCSVHESHGKHWIGLPGKPQLHRNRELIRDADGRPRYSPVVEFATKKVADVFGERVLETLDRHLQLEEV